MAKKEKAPMSEGLLKAWGAVAFVGLTGRLFYCASKAQTGSGSKRTIQKPWKVFFITMLIALLLIAALVGGFLALRHYCFPEYRMPIELIAGITLGAIFVLGTVITIVESRIHKRR